MTKKTKGGKRFVKAASSIILTVATILGSFGLVAKNKAERISDESQVETIAEALGCDLSYMKYNKSGGVIRMMHNGDEPIYVHVTEEMNDEETGLIKESLDYVFDIVGNINQAYKYEIVDKQEYNKQKILGKTTIVYKESDCASGLVDSTGQITRKTNDFESASKNDYYTTHVIEYDREESKNLDLDQKLYTFIHELLHAFGFDDVYIDGPNKKTDINYKNTFMKGYSFDGNIITPNDLGCFLSAYKEKVNEEELEGYIEKADELLKRYEKYYYENRVEKLKNYETNEILNLDGKDIDSEFTSKLVNLDGSEMEQGIKLKIEGNKYILEVSGADRENPSIAIGEVIDVNGVKVLKNAKFSGSFDLTETEKIEETIMDLYLVRLESRDMLYDASNFGSMWGKNMQKQKMEK